MDVGNESVGLTISILDRKTGEWEESVLWITEWKRCSEKFTWIRPTHPLNLLDLHCHNLVRSRWEQVTLTPHPLLPVKKGGKFPVKTKRKIYRFGSPKVLVVHGLQMSPLVELTYRNITEIEERRKYEH